jgi:translation initiation factor 2 subunit 2
MFVGRRDPDDFTRLLKIYVNEYIMCPTCKSPDTRTEKDKRISFLICEACGAKSTIKGKYS